MRPKTCGSPKKIDINQTSNKKGDLSGCACISRLIGRLVHDENRQQCLFDGFHICKYQQSLSIITSSSKEDHPLMSSRLSHGQHHNKLINSDNTFFKFDLYKTLQIRAFWAITINLFT